MANIRLRGLPQLYLPLSLVSRLQSFYSLAAMHGSYGWRPFSDIYHIIKESALVVLDRRKGVAARRQSTVPACFTMKPWTAIIALIGSVQKKSGPEPQSPLLRR